MTTQKELNGNIAPPAVCSECGKLVAAGESYLYHSKVLCEDCFLDARMRPGRKTHYQYLKTIKTEYLIPRKKD